MDAHNKFMKNSKRKQSWVVPGSSSSIRAELRAEAEINGRAILLAGLLLRDYSVVKFSIKADKKWLEKTVKMWQLPAQVLSWLDFHLIGVSQRFLFWSEKKLTLTLKMELNYNQADNCHKSFASIAELGT